MEFLKEFTKKRKKRIGDGTLIIFENKLSIRLSNKLKIKKIGFIDGGIGIETEDKLPLKSQYTVGIYKNVDFEYLPEEMRTKNYRYFIKAKKISENELVFLYNEAKILNKK